MDSNYKVVVKFRETGQVVTIAEPVNAERGISIANAYSKANGLWSWATWKMQSHSNDRNIYYGVGSGETSEPFAVYVVELDYDPASLPDVKPWAFSMQNYIDNRFGGHTKPVIEMQGD